MKNKPLGVSFLFLAFLLLAVFACTALALPTFDPSAVPTLPDYAEEANWLALPEGEPQKAVDVFWVYPTVLYGDTSWIMDVRDPANRKAANATIKRQASVFTEYANLYAPMYRQMNLAGLGLSEQERDARTRYGHDDIRRALEYYLEHYNDGRPFILAGHSQGSMLLTDIMVELWGELGAEDRMVAAYLIGWSITEEDLKRNPRMDICTHARQTGCFITYNSVGPGMQDKAPTILPGAMVVNPLSWKTDTAPAPATRNMGAVFFTDDHNEVTYPHFASAQVQGSGLVVTPADPSLLESNNDSFPEGVYHPYDYSLFYENLRANGLERIRALGSSDEP